MKRISVTFSPDGRYKWLLFIAAILVQCGVLGFFAWRYHNITVDGIPYQWQCVPRIEMSSFGTDYIRVVFPEDTTEWLDDSYPVENQTVYIRIARDEKGLMEIKGASAEPPLIGEDYMKAKVVNYENGRIQFQVAFNRYRIEPEKADGIYQIAPGDSVIASIRMKKGEGVVEGIFVNGIPIEDSSNGAAMEAARKAKEGDKGDKGDKTSSRTRIVESGMVPPKSE